MPYKTFKLQEYLASPLFNNESRNLLFRLRTRTINGIKGDFKGLYTDTSCPMGCGVSDTIQHLLTCMVLRRYHTSTNISISDSKYEDIFSEDTRKQKCITELFRKLLEIRSEVISQPVVTRTGPMHNGSNSNTTVLQSDNCQTPVLGLGLGVDFTLANNNNNPHLIFHRREGTRGLKFSTQT